jgi:predicted ribosomally synthesized peptide with SipW-like signal peptide
MPKGKEFIMTNKKSTKKALISSALCLLLCLSMLVGTTFAWFTDSVSTTNNIITAGNLDVMLEYSKDFKNWAEVNSETNVFSDEKWEPGHTEVVYLRVKNVGSLAMKYNLTINIASELGSVNVAGENFKLSNYIYYGVKSVTAAYENRAAAQNDITDAVQLNAPYVPETQFLYPTNTEGKDSEVVLAMVVYMPTTVGNEANHKTGYAAPTINLGINLLATQMTYEEDSYGSNFDEEAWLNEADFDWYDPDATTLVIDTPAELVGLAALVNGYEVTTYAAGKTEKIQDSFKGKTITLAADIDLNNMLWVPIGTSDNSFKGIFDGNGHTISNLLVTGNNSNAGLFGCTTEGEIKNLTVENAKVSGRLNVGVVAGTPYTTKYTNITVKGHVEVNGMAYVGGVGGKNAYADWTDITVNVDETSYVKANSVEYGNAYRTYVGGVVGFNGEGGHTFKNITSNIDVYGSTCDVGGAFGIAHYGNTFENVTVSGDVTITNATEADEVEEMGGIAGVWNNGGADVTFTNCKFEGKLSANFTEGVDLSNNTITGKAYSATGAGKLNIDGEVSVLVDTAEELVAALGQGLNVVVSADLKNIPVNTTAPYGNKYGISLNGGVLDGNNYVLDFNTSGDNYCIMTSGGTIKNMTIGGGFRGIVLMYPTETVYIDNVTICDADVVYAINTTEGDGKQSLVVTNSTIGGWTSYSTIKDATFTDCTFVQGKGYTNAVGRVLKPYINTTLTRCEFVKSMNLDLSELRQGEKITFVNCTVDGQPLTADVITVPVSDADYDTELFTVDLPSWATSIADFIVFQ